MKKEEILTALTDLGLKETEAKIYFYLSKKGPKKAKEIQEAVGITKQRLYIVLKSLQNNAIVSSSLDKPAKFTAIPLKKLLDLFAKQKLEEVKIIQKNRSKLISDWQLISNPKPESKVPNFSVITGRKNVFLKIKQLTEETQSVFSVIIDVSDFLRTDQFGVWEFIEKFQTDSKKRFRFVILALNETSIPISTLKRFNSKILIKLNNSILGQSLFPKVVIRDNKEFMYFISTSQADNGYNCLFTDCKSLVQTFSNIFEDAWSNSTSLEKRLHENEAERILSIIKNPHLAKSKFETIIAQAKQNIMILTSSEGLLNYQKSIQRLQKIIEKDVPLRIMAPITRNNLRAAHELERFSEVKHIPSTTVDAILVDGQHLFQFKNPIRLSDELWHESVFKDVFYSNDSDFIKTRNEQFMKFWSKATCISDIALNSEINLLNSFVPSKNQFTNKTKFFPDCLTRDSLICDDWSVTTNEASSGRITEKDVLQKIIDADKNMMNSSDDTIFCFCSSLYAVIQADNNLNLPRMLIEAACIDKKSSFGAEDKLIIYLWSMTQKGPKFIPVAVIGDNPNLPKNMMSKGRFKGTPAEKNYHLVEKDEIQFRVYGNTFLANWEIPIPLRHNQMVLLPGTLIVEGIGPVTSRSIVVSNNFARYGLTYNSLDAFVTFSYQSSRYTGPSTDGILLRESCLEITFKQ